MPLPVASMHAASATPGPQSQRSDDDWQQTQRVGTDSAPLKKKAESMTQSGTPLHAVDSLQYSRSNNGRPNAPQFCAAPGVPGEGAAQDPRSPTYVTDGLFLGGVEQALSAPRLRALRITHIVNASREDGDLHLEQFQYLHINARDNTHERLTPYFAEVAQWVDNARRAGGNALIHCREGVSRSATLVLATRMIHERVPLFQAFRQLKACRQQIEPNPQFLSELRQLELSLLGCYCKTRLTALDDLRMPEPADAAIEQTQRLMAKAAAFAQARPHEWPEWTQARHQLVAQWDQPQVFEHCLLRVMEAYAGSSVNDSAAQSALRQLLVALALSVPGNEQAIVARCEQLFMSEEWQDLCIDAPLLPPQAKKLISSLRPGPL